MRQEPRVIAGLTSAAAEEALGDMAGELRDEIELVKGASHDFDADRYLAGQQTPVFFGSALNNFGVIPLLDEFVEQAPAPQPRPTLGRPVRPEEDKLTGFVFKVQANMDPNHRDRIAFARLCSGKLTRGMKVKQTRTGKLMSLNAPQFFFAQDRSVADEAYAGDVVGIPNHGVLRIGDTLTEGEELTFMGVPSFAPEILRRAKLGDAMKAKKLKTALQQMAEEGVVQVFNPQDGSPALVGVVGPLQLDVLRARLAAEYNIEASFEQSEFNLARWVSGEDRKKVDDFANGKSSSVATDLDGDLVFLAKSQFDLDYTRERAPGIEFSDVKDVKKQGGK